MKYIPNTGVIADQMLKEMGLRHIDDLLGQIPEDVRNRNTLSGLPNTKSELEVRSQYSSLSKKNTFSPQRVFCGAGIYSHDIPSAIDAIAGRAEFLTSYTPYQPEISQGTLISIYEFQTMVSRLFEMEVTNASMYDGSTAFAEALLMAKRLRPSASKIFYSMGIHPEVIATAKTTLEGLDIEWLPLSLNASGGTELKPGQISSQLDNILAVAVQSPNFFGVVENLNQIRKAWPGQTPQYSAAAGIQPSVANFGSPLYVVHTGDPHAFGILQAPGLAGADIVTAEGQPLGCYPAYGGPAVGLFSTRSGFVRQMPGRLVGKTKDSDGRESYCLTLSTREQHIRREKATSNICTNQGWCALRVAMYLAMRGPTGLTEVAEQSHSKAMYLADHLSKIDGVKLLFKSGFYNEFLVQADRLEERFKNAVSNGIVPGVRLSQYSGMMSGNFGNSSIALDDLLLVCASELMTKKDLDDYVTAFALKKN